MTDQRFSERLGLRADEEVEISVRADAPYELRGVLVDLAYECGMSPKPLRSVVCRILRKRPDPDNWSEFPNIDGELRHLIDECEWYFVYDIVEAIAQKMSEAVFNYDSEQFAQELNVYFVRNGIGWKLTGTTIEAREPQSLENTISRAKKTLEQRAPTAHKELAEALRDLSRRPDPDVTGAIQHAMASLECLARQITGNSRATLGEILKRNPELLSPPLDQAISKLWGYASEYARHVRESRVASFREAQLLVGVCAAVATYLLDE